MWVSTTGEDSPQCILDSPAGDPVHYTLQPCRSLNYALTNIRSETVIGIACGIHVLEPVRSLSHGTPMVNLTIVGDCANGTTQILCTNGANLAFYNIQNAVIKMVSFHGCGEQLQHSARDSVPDSSTLYFQNCRKITIHHVLINITGPYGRGIAFLRHDTSITHGDVLIEYVSILHFGIHGSGLHFEVLTGKTRDASPASEKIRLKKIHVHNERAYPECDPTMAFTGINITVGGDGHEGGGVIALINITVTKTTSGSGISLALLGRVNGFHAYFIDCQIIEGWTKNHRKNSTAESCNTYEHPSSSTESDESTVYHSTSINIEVRENSMKNHIHIGSALVKEHTPVSGNSLFIKVADQSKKNVITLEEVTLLRLNSSGANRRGLQITVTGWARRNRIQGIVLFSLWHKAYWGGGGYIEFSEHATGNLVTLERSLFHYNHALRGGGIAVVCRDFANQNTFQFDSTIENNFAEMGGGAYISFQNSASNNTIHLIVDIINNTAHCGGGIFIQFHDTSVGSTVELLDIIIMENTLLPSKTYDMMGGGVHVDFSTVNATYRTDNNVTFTRCTIYLNNAGQGVGGGISVLYKHSHYHGNSGDGVNVHSVMLFHNTASSGSACSFQSYPTHGKKLFRGIRIGSVFARLIPEFQKMDSDSLHNLMSGKIEDLVLLSHVSSADKQSMSTISEQLSQAIFPSFQAKTNTNLIFAKSVQVVVRGQLVIQCVASSQGLYALDSEIVLEAVAHSEFQHCVATHGGAIALYGESYIRVGKNASLEFEANHAFQRGGAIYVRSAPGVVSASDCFLQYDQGEEKRGELIFYGNTAKAEGQSVYVSDIRNCFSGRTQIITTHLINYPNEDMYFVSSTFVRQMNFTFIFNRTLYDTYYRHHLPLNISQLTSKEYRLQVMKSEIVSGPYHVSGTTVDWSKPLTLCFTPGKQKRLPYTVAYDELGSNISSVFTVLINKVDHSMPVELDSFSKFTDDFTVILHGIPQQHGMAYQSFKFPRGTGKRSAVVRPPQLVLQSLDNKDLLLMMNIELQCCPPGYIFRYGSGDKGTCHCGMTTVTGIIDCNESHPEMIGAVLDRNHWAGYLASNDLHSCAGQKFFTGRCPPGYCHTQKIILHENYSHQELQIVVCGESSRKGLLCGDCSEGKGIAVNFNGIRPVCVS